MSTVDSNNASNPVRILMVDDDVAFSRVVRAILQLYRQRTFIITWKESVESALVEIEQNQEIDLILVDYYFPTSNGLEFCLQLDQMGRSIPIIFLTGSRDFKLAVEAMKLGVEDYLLKEDLDQAYLPRTILSILDRVHVRKHKLAVEKRLAMAENRAQAIRELVVTVCHEFNNPLAAIKISFDLLQRQTVEIVAPEIMRSFESRFNTIDSEIKHLRDLNFEKIDFHEEKTSNSQETP
ncbi:MAG: response regulator [Bacteroidota bacterium]|jgi:FixJ family two-component response regulator